MRVVGQVMEVAACRPYTDLIYNDEMYRALGIVWTYERGVGIDRGGTCIGRKCGRCWLAGGEDRTAGWCVCASVWFVLSKQADI